VLEVDFNNGSSQLPSFVTVSDGKIDLFCARPSATFGAEGGVFEVALHQIVPAGTYLSFDLALGCPSAAVSFSVAVEYTADSGQSWKPVSIVVFDSLPLPNTALWWHMRRPNQPAPIHMDLLAQQHYRAPHSHVSNSR